MVDLADYVHCLSFTRSSSIGVDVDQPLKLFHNSFSPYSLFVLSLIGNLIQFDHIKKQNCHKLRK